MLLVLAPEEPAAQLRETMLTALLLLASLAGAPASPSRSVASPTGRPPVDSTERTVVWAIDGLSYEAFEVARQRGLFARFAHAGRHIAPYPSMSHPSWTEITGARRVFGERANIRTVEARWFDLEAMRVADDPRQVFARQAGPFNYMRAFDWFFDPLVEPLMYFRGDSLAARELAEAERDILERFRGRQHVVFIGGVDAIAHTQRGVLFGYLTRLDAMMRRVSDSLAARGGPPVRHVIISDHGNAGRFREGAAESYLTPVSLSRAFREAKLVRRDTGTLTAPNQAAVVTIALASMVNVYFADLSRRRAFAEAAVRDSAVDLVTWHEVADGDQFVVVLSRTRGESRIRWRRHTDGTFHYAIEAVRGNPLQLPPAWLSTREAPRWIPDASARAGSATHPYPDALNRLVRSATKEVENAPDLIVNLRDGFCFAGDFGRYVRMVRTHGALGARATLGLVATATTPIPDAVRSDEILPLLGIAPDSLFHRHLALVPHDEHATAHPLAPPLADQSPRLPTGRDDVSPDAAFLRRVKPLVLSTGYLSASMMQSLLRHATPDAAGSAARRRQLEQSRRAVRASDVVRGVTTHVDSLWPITQGLPSGANGPDANTLSTLLDRTTAQLRGIPELAPLATLRDLWLPRARTGATPPLGRAESVRQAAMLAWTVPYFVNAALDAPESDSIDDPRDRAFALTWHRTERARVRQHPLMLLRDSALAARLFAEVFAERRLLRAVETSSIPRLYDGTIGEVAVLYVPGIFGELFDDEIWQRGLVALREQLGLRIVPARTDGRCSAADNATRLLQTMREDTERRVARGYARPRYLIVGYSKGGVDAAEALARDPAVAASQVAALVTIASPHGGSPVAERTDLPDALLRAVIRAPRPLSCDTTRAVESLWPATRAAFWSGPGRTLATHVPLVTVSLASSLRDAHPWMKITKRLAGFVESNDGVVARTASRIPSHVPSIDLGEVAGDHIAGRVASDFPQESFLEAVVLTVRELGLLQPDGAARWRAAVDSMDRARATAAILPARPAPGPSARPARAPLALPGHIGWRADRTYKMSSLEALADRPLPELRADALPEGLIIRCDHDDMTAFRAEYEFLYDAGNGGSEHNLDNGFAIVDTDSTASGRACRLRTHRSAMKMTTASLRFRPDLFPTLALRLQVAQSVRAVAPDKGGRGKNDATLKLWLVLRDERPEAKGKRLLFGYTWAARDANGAVPRADSLVEGGASRRRIGFSVLPEAWLINVGGPSEEGRWLTITRDLVADLRRAYPTIPLEFLRVLAITVQTDSDESRGDTEVLLDHLSFRPARFSNPNQHP